MSIRGLAISQGSESDDSAYTHRILKLAECLRERSIPCDTFYLPDHPPLRKQTSASLFMPLWLRKLREYDFMYCGAEPAAQALFLCRAFLKSPIIVDIHGDEVAQSQLFNEVQSNGRNRSASLRVRTVHSMGMAVADHLLTVATPQIETFVRDGIPREKISLVRNGVDLELFRPLPQPTRPEFTFAYVGEFQHWQGIDNLIGAFEKLTNQEARMLIVGFREGDREIKQRFHETFGTRVRLVDRTDRPTLVKLLKTASILIIPRIDHLAVRHAFPTKFGEYAAMARPIMVNDVDETADFVRDYRCGFVSSPNPEAMAQVMDDASRVPWENLAEMGQRARSAAEEHFSWKRIGDEYAEVVRKLVVESGRSGGS